MMPTVSRRDGEAEPRPLGALLPLWQSRRADPSNLMLLPSDTIGPGPLKLHVPQLLARIPQSLAPDFLGLPYANHERAASDENRYASSTISELQTELPAPQSRATLAFPVYKPNSVGT